MLYYSTVVDALPDSGQHPKAAAGAVIVSMNWLQPGNPDGQTACLFAVQQLNRMEIPAAAQSRGLEIPQLYFRT